MNKTRSRVFRTLAAATAVSLSLLAQACDGGPEIRIENPKQLTEVDIFHRGEIKIEKHCSVLIDGRREKVKFGKLDQYGDECVGALRLVSLNDDVQLFVKYVSYFRTVAGTLKARIITVDGQDVTFDDATATYGSDNFIVDGLGHQYTMLPRSVDGESVVGKKFVQVEIPSVQDRDSTIITTEVADAPISVEPTAEPTATQVNRIWQQPVVQPTVPLFTEDGDDGYEVNFPVATAVVNVVSVSQPVKHEAQNPYDCTDSFGESVPFATRYGTNGRWLCTGKGFNKEGNPYFNFFDFLEKKETSVIYDLDSKKLLIEEGHNAFK
ncbi:hypothetical protein KBC70_01325 [Candidatus Woesebacteria bacterium]|nr:hypothetical protein [Candidatus Woesebacteria bacterium]